MTAYYNEKDPAAAAVLRELIACNVIASGDVDDRSIKEVSPDELAGYTQCHFFAGGGLWSVAARLAGWPDARPLWTGSCPCQPYSAAGKGLGTDDPRHLWPDFHRLIRACRPAVVMGEQVAGAAGYGWFDGVSADLANEDYASRTVDIPACAVDAPHQRNRLYWIASLQSDAQEQRRRPGLCQTEAERHGHVLADDHVRVQPDANGSGIGGADIEVRRPDERTPAWRADASLLAHADFPELQGQSSTGQQSVEQSAASSLRNGSWWADGEWFVSPLDGKARRAKSDIRFLVDGLPGRMDLWRVGGNAILPILAAEVIAAFLDAEVTALSPIPQMLQPKDS